jgi:aspartyl-tRNA synthetase
VLDLRRPQMQQNLMLRYRVAMEVRKFLDKQRLHRHRDADADQEHARRRARLPRARRVHDGQFFALPQSPQLFKQLLMVAGFDRYYQITKCFRDEDLRADRQPEFTQIDIETSFLTEVEIRDMFEGMIRTRVQERDRRRPAEKFPVMTYADAMRRVRLGQARPARQARVHRADRRHGRRRLQGVLVAANDEGGRVVGLRVPGGAEISRGEIDATPRSCDLRREGPGLDQGQRRRQGPRRPAVARSSRTCTTRRSPRSSSAPARKTAT